MAHGLYGYAVDLDRLQHVIGSKDDALLATLRERFTEPLSLNKRWFAAHAADRDLLSLDEALEWLVIAPPERFDDQTTNVGYGLEMLCYHLGHPIHLGRAGRKALRDITLAELTDVLDAAELHLGSAPLDGASDLKRALLVRPLAAIENLASYPGTGYLRRDEVQRCFEVLRDAQRAADRTAAGAVQGWSPLLRLLEGAAERRCDLATFYY